MKCGKCGKEFQTYNGICPFCKSKNEKDAQEQPTIKYTPIVKPDPPVYDKPKNPTDNIRSQNSVKTKKTSENPLKYALMAGVVLLVVLSVAAMAQSFIGGSPPSVSAPEIHVTPEETVPPLYPTAVPISVIPTTITQQTWAPIVTVVQRTVAQRTVVQRTQTEPTYISSSGEVWTQADYDFLDYSSKYSTQIGQISYQMSYKASLYDVAGLGNDGEILRETAKNAFFSIEPLQVSSALKNCKNNFLNALRSDISSGDLAAKAGDAYLHGDIQKATYLLSDSLSDLNDANYWMKLTTETFPKGLQ